MSDRDLDQQLVKRAQEGEKRAFNLLIAKYQRRLARLLSRFIRDGADIEDVTQETFIKAYRALPTFRGESAFYTWLYRIGINTAKNFLTANRRRPLVLNAANDGEDDGFDALSQLADLSTPETELMNRQIIEAVNVAVDALPEELRTAISLREMEGLSYDEIAETMNCPIGTVRSRIFRAREAIAAELRPLLDTAKNKRW
ncbi:RNA polymerase sigma factor RpoE [Neisseriaceae bacterium TC5R-5]|nr:RNA polymerase sigma factor RpoE [Neisseriaceae bacterium TC5R-5]